MGGVSDFQADVLGFEIGVELHVAAYKSANYPKLFVNFGFSIFKPLILLDENTAYSAFQAECWNYEQSLVEVASDINIWYDGIMTAGTAGG